MGLKMTLAYCLHYYYIGTSSEQMRESVVQSRERQTHRFKDSSVFYNAQMSSREIRKYCKLDKECKSLLKTCVNELGLSARAHDKVLRVSRTIADLAESAEILSEHLSEAISYRTLDRGLWK